MMSCFSRNTCCMWCSSPESPSKAHNDEIHRYHMLLWYLMEPGCLSTWQSQTWADPSIDLNNSQSLCASKSYIGGMEYCLHSSETLMQHGDNDYVEIPVWQFWGPSLCCLSGLVILQALNNISLIKLIIKMHELHSRRNDQQSNQALVAGLTSHLLLSGRAYININQAEIVASLVLYCVDV